MNNFFLETIKVQDGKIFHLEYHQKRYERVLFSLGKTAFKNLHDFLIPPQEGLFRCRVLYSKTSIEVSYYPYTKRHIQKLKLIFDDTIEYDKKYADRSRLDEHFALREDADDILIIKNGFVTDTSIANVVFFDGIRWITPREPLLKGTTRARLLESRAIFEADIAVNDLKDYKQVALLNAMIDFDIISKSTKGLYC